MSRFCLIAFVVFVPVAVAQPKKGPTAQVMRLEVRAPVPAEGDRRALPGSTVVNVRVTVPDRELVGLDRTSKLTWFTDDRGTDLSTDTILKDAHASIAEKDRSHIDFMFLSNVAPAGKAREFRFKADLRVLAGVGVETVSETVACTPGTEKTIGPVGLKIGANAKTTTLTLNYTREQLKDVTFEDGNGQAVKAQPYSGSGGRDPRNPNFSNWRQEYRLESAPAKLTVRVNAYKKIEVIDVPVDLVFGLGLE